MKLYIQALSAIIISISISGCAAFAPKPPIKFSSLNDSKKQLRAVLEYNSVPYTNGLRCIGQAKIENYGQNNYRDVVLKLSFYTADRELIAKDDFYLTSGLMAYSKVSIPPGSGRMLHTADGQQVWLGCPKEKLNQVLFEFTAY